VATLEASGDDADLLAQLAYSAAAFAGRAYEAHMLDQTLGLSSNGNYQTGARGFGERYVQGAGNRQYVLFPDGRFFHFAGPYVASTPLVETGPQANLELLGTFDESFWQDPARLHDAPPPPPLDNASTPPSPVSVAGNQLEFLTPTSFAGDLYVRVTAHDGFVSAADDFKVTVTNTVPTIAAIPDQAAPSGTTSLSIPIAAADADGDSVSFLAPEVVEMANLARSLDQQLDFVDPGNGFYFDFYGLGEKWLRSAVDQNWYCLLPTGALHLLGNTAAGLSPGNANPIGLLIAAFDTSYYDDPTKLIDVAVPAAASLAAVMDGSNLEITIGVGYRGVFRAIVEATDGMGVTQEDLFITIGP